MRWHGCDHAPLCNFLHPDWEFRQWGRLNFSTHTISLYHQIFMGRSKFRDRRCYINCNGRESSLWRRGYNVTKTVQHVFFECSRHYHDTMDLRNICCGRGVDYNMSILFTYSALEARVEMFLRDVISKSDFYCFWFS